MTPEERYPLSDWQYEVASGDTRLGYEEWVKHNVESHTVSLAEFVKRLELSKDHSKPVIFVGPNGVECALDGFDERPNGTLVILKSMDRLYWQVDQ